MRLAAWSILLAASAVVLLAVLPRSGDVLAEAAEPAAASRPLPPLEVDKGAPLLLLDKPAAKAADKAGPRADNSACFCCHGNYKSESLVTVHAERKVGCIQCHGESSAHRDDEGNVTPPDKMYWPERVGPMCQECHETHDVPAQMIVARWRERCSTKEKPEEIVCTDCHGEHRLPSRLVVWDKKSGRLARPDTRQPGATPAKNPRSQAQAPFDKPGE